MSNPSDVTRQPETEMRETRDRRPRRPYSRPQLIEYGSIAKLTRGTRSGTGEFTPQGEKRMCL